MPGSFWNRCPNPRWNPSTGSRRDRHRAEETLQQSAFHRGYDYRNLHYLRMLYARIGDPHCWICGRSIPSMTVGQMAMPSWRPAANALSCMRRCVRDRKGEYAGRSRTTPRTVCARAHRRDHVRDRGCPDAGQEQETFIDVVVRPPRLERRREAAPGGIHRDRGASHGRHPQGRGRKAKPCTRSCSAAPSTISPTPR
jgi:hypothetical protein